MSWLGKAGSFPEGKPAVFLLLDSQLEEGMVRAIGAGCEEEGVPLCWDYRQGSADQLALAASGRSRLEVGIGVDRNGASVALQKITASPYICVSGCCFEQLRWVGQAAARLSKGEPLPSSENTPHSR